MIILEGPDGAGKTRLAQRLSGDLGLLIQPKVVDSTTQAMVDLKLWVEQDLRQGLKARLYDRHRLISEPIYGPVVRGRMEPGFHDLRWLTTQQWMFELLRPLVIFCLPHIEVVRHNVEDDPENTTVAGQIDLIYWLYHNAASRCGITPKTSRPSQAGLPTTSSKTTSNTGYGTKDYGSDDQEPLPTVA
jgi:hypothetical protein